MNIIDCHTHSTNSFDGYDAPEAMLLSAMEKGLSAYALTDHCEINRWFPYAHYDHEHTEFFPQDTFDFAHSFEHAMEDNLRLKEKYRGRIAFINGIELGQAQFDFGLARAIAADSRLDFVIGSVHQVRGFDDFAFLDYTPNSADRLLEQYFNEVYEVCREGIFDVLGHLTYPLRYIEGSFGIKPDLSRYDDIVAESFKEIISKGKGIELNTSGLRQKYGRPFPDIHYLKMYHDLGGEIISIGSDAHRTDDIAEGFSEGAELLSTAGFKYLFYFEKHEPVAVSI